MLATSPLRGDAIALLESLGELFADPWIAPERIGHAEAPAPPRIYDAQALSRRIRELSATVVICEADECRGPVLDSGVDVICSTRGSPDNVDVPGATERGIPVLHTPGRNADAVAELVIGLALAVTRMILPADADVRSQEVFRDGTLPYQRFRAWELSASTVGLIGLGSTGSAARWRFEALGAQVISYDPFNDEATHEDLDELLGSCDIVSMHAAVTPLTISMMGEAQFAAMRRGAVYLNAARAGLHDTDALVRALESGHLHGAGLDHFSGELLPVDHPLLTMRNVVLTPHIGGATFDTEVNHTRMIAEDLARLMDGRRPVHCANPEVLS